MMQPFDDPETPARIVGEHDAPLVWVRFHPDGHLIAASDSDGQVRLWPLDPSQTAQPRVLTEARNQLQFDNDGNRLATYDLTADGYLAEIWDLSHPVGAAPLRILSPGPSGDEDPAFSPDGRWLTTNHAAGRALWPLSHPYPIVLPLPEGPPQGMDVAFTPDGNGLVSSAAGELRLWDLATGGRARVPVE